MFKVEWDIETGGVKLSSLHTKNSLGVSPRPVFFEELDLLKLNQLGWEYPHCQEPLLWACNKQYYCCGELVFEVKGANIYDDPTVVFAEGKEKLSLQPVDVSAMLEKCSDEMFLAESEAIEFIRDAYVQYSSARKSVEKVKANQMDFEALAAKIEKQTKQKMAIVKQDCDSFDIMPLENAKQEGKRTYATTKIDVFLASFSGGKDSQVVLDLCSRAIPPQAFEVIYSDTGYELPTSLTLYDEIQQYYKGLYPELRFRIARNHECVLNYWDKIGTPSDTHRWCCSVMKTAPLHKMLKVDGTNKQARVLVFEGSRGEESNRRATYDRIGKGVKHTNVINARPILNWNTTEVYLYIFKYNLQFNQAYRIGKPRVGCLICPFSSEWDDMIVNKFFPKQLEPFITRLKDWSKKRGVTNLDEYIKGHKWKLRASGKFMDVKTSVNFTSKGKTLVANVFNPQSDILIWINVLGECNITKNTDCKKVKSELKIKRNIYPFEIEYNNTGYKISISNISDATLIGYVKRVIYKSAFCIQCEVCEVECPTGALRIYPNFDIDKKKCTHCYKCLSFHERGCVVADSLSMAQEIDFKKMTGISGYGTFGLREEWLSEFILWRNDFWKNHALGPKQVPSMKSWLKDSLLIDGKTKITDLGEYLATIYQDYYDLIWEVIWINLSNNSPLIKWFINNVPLETSYSKSSLIDLYSEQYQEGKTTFEYALGALFNLFASSPIGEQFSQKIDVSKTEFKRSAYDGISREAVAYSLYKYAESVGTKSLRVSDLYQEDSRQGVFREFGLSRSAFESQLRSLNSDTNRVLVAELNMGLDSITLRDDLDALDALKILTK